MLHIKSRHKNSMGLERFMVHGLWFMGYGSWVMVHGLWFMGYGSWEWLMGYGIEIDSHPVAKS